MLEQLVAVHGTNWVVSRKDVTFKVAIALNEMWIIAKVLSLR
jgi:hypothetical protein